MAVCVFAACSRRCTADDEIRGRKRIETLSKREQNTHRTTRCVRNSVRDVFGPVIRREGKGANFLMEVVVVVTIPVENRLLLWYYAYWTQQVIENDST